MARTGSPLRPTAPTSTMSPAVVEVLDRPAQVVTPEMPKKPIYYIEGIGNRLKPEMRRLFETYGGIPSEEVEAHLYAARQAAWQLHPYPCLGMWSFLNPVIRHIHSYPTLLSLAKTPGARILDVGCGLGQDLRQLVFDGVPAENIYASDTEAGLWRLGMGLFMDEGRLCGGAREGEVEGKGVQFMRGNLLDLDERESDAEGSARCLADWKGTFDVVYAGNVLHLFIGDDVVRAAKNMLALTKPGGRIILYQIGGQGRWPPVLPTYDSNNTYTNNNNTTNDKQATTTATTPATAAAAAVAAAASKGAGLPGYAHNGTSWRELWARVEKETGVTAAVVETWSRGFAEWEVPMEDIGWFPPGSCAFEVFVRRED